MTLILQFFNIDKGCEEFVAVTNVPQTSLFMFLSGDSFYKFCTWVLDRLYKDFPRRCFVFYGITRERRMRRNLLCSYDYMDWVQTSSND